MDAQGSSGGIIVFWDKRWNCKEELFGLHSVTVFLKESNIGFSCIFPEFMGHVTGKEERIVARVGKNQ